MKDNRENLNENKKNLPIKKSSNEKEEKDGIFRKFINILNERWLQSGLTTVMLVLIIFAIYLGVNILLDKVILPDIDLTENKIYSLSEETNTKLKNIDKEVKITLINYGQNESFIKLIEKYTTINKLISLERIDDLASRTDIMQKYSLEITDTLILISSGNKEKTISENDLYTFDYSTYEEIDATEETITNAIIDITTEDKPVIYFMTNHTRYNKNYFETVLTSLENEANIIKDLDLLAEGVVPEDCDTLIITSLREDITEGERDKIIDYINRGGEILLMYGSDTENIQCPNFQAVLSQYGITIGEEVAIGRGTIFEGSSSNMLSGYPDIIVEEVPSNSVTKNINMSINVCFVDATPIIMNEEKLEELGVEYETLITTSDRAFVRTDLTQNSATRTSQDSEYGESILGVLATKKIDDNTSSKIVVYSNELFATKMPIQIMGYTYEIVDLYNNKDIVLNSVAYLNEREDIITIRKNYDSVSYTVTEIQHNVIMAIIFIIPVIVIIIGIVVWMVRRRKK